MQGNGTVGWGVPNNRSLKLIDFNAVTGHFEGYGSVFGNEDLTGDIVERGAFARTIKEAEARRTANKGRFLWPLLAMHDQTRAIGGIESATEDSHGLRIEGMVDVSTPAGQAAYAGMKSGYSNGFSIGYDTKKAYRDAKGVRHLTELKLWEISLITLGFAANEQAAVDPISVKSADNLRPVIERMVSIVANDKGWMSQRPQLAGSYAPARAPVEDEPPPNRADYVTEAKFQDALDLWRARITGRDIMAQERERKRAEWLAEIKAHRDQRVRNGSATLDEMLAYTDETGLLPSGRPYDFAAESKRVRLAYQALFERMESGEED